MSNVFDFPSRDMSPTFADPESVLRRDPDALTLDDKMDVFLRRLREKPGSSLAFDYQDAIFSSISADAWPDEINYPLMAERLATHIFNNDAKALGELLIKYGRPWLIDVLEDEIG